MIKYVVEFETDYGEGVKVYRVFQAKPGLSWRDLQVIFDPTYYYNYLKFFSLGSEIKNID